MVDIKQYIAETFKGNTYHFKCDCVLSLDVAGKVVDYEINNGEIVLFVSVNSRIIKLGLNHPNLSVEKL